MIMTVTFKHQERLLHMWYSKGSSLFSMHTLSSSSIYKYSDNCRYTYMIMHHLCDPSVLKKIDSRDGHGPKSWRSIYVCGFVFMDHGSQTFLFKRPAHNPCGPWLLACPTVDTFIKTVRIQRTVLLLFWKCIEMQRITAVLMRQAKLVYKKWTKERTLIKESCGRTLLGQSIIKIKEDLRIY